VVIKGGVAVTSDHTFRTLNRISVRDDGGMVWEKLHSREWKTQSRRGLDRGAFGLENRWEQVTDYAYSLDVIRGIKPSPFAFIAFNE
jgi:hypothetical protein